MRDGLASIPEAAEVLGVHQNTVRNWVKSGRLPSEVRTENGRRVTRIPVDRIVASRGVPPSAVSATAQILSEKISEMVGEHLLAAVPKLLAEIYAGGVDEKLCAMQREIGRLEATVAARDHDIKRLLNSPPDLLRRLEEHEPTG